MPSRPRISLPKTTRTSDADEVERRKERGRSAHYVFRNLQSDYPIYSNFEVLSDSGKTYEVEVRDLAWRQVFCTCVDFRINKLGTCKHVEALIDDLETKEPKAYAEALEGVSQRIDIVPGEQPGSLMVERGIEKMPPALRRVVSDEGVISPSLAETFLDACKAYSPLVRISLELKELLSRQRRQKECLELRREYEAGVRRGDTPPNETLVPLYPYQREGMLHLAFQERAVIADEFGLDRAPQAIGACLLLRRLKRCQRVLIITSSSLIPLWESEIREYAGTDYLIAEGAAKRRISSYGMGSDFTIMRFEDAVSDVEAINAVLKPDVIILDEAQRIRDWHSPTAMRIKQLESRYGFVFTSSDVGESPDEIYSIMSFVDPTVLGPLFRFNRDYYAFDASGNVSGVQNLDRLREKIRPYFLRRSRVEVASQIPKRSERTYFVGMTRYQRELYARHEAIVHALLKQSKKGSLGGSQKETLMREMGMLRMICDSPAVLGEEDKRSGKLAELEPILRECLQKSEHKVVVFSEWERMLHLVEDVCQRLGISIAWNKGSLPGKVRRKEIERFNMDEDCRVLLSTDAIASGIQLKESGVIINCDIPWSPEKLEQRISRIHCLNPLHSLSVIHLVASDTVERKIFDRWTKTLSRRGTQIEASEEDHVAKAPKFKANIEEFFITPKDDGPSLSENIRLEIVKLSGEAQRKLKLARVLRREDFLEESAGALREALIIVGNGLGLMHGFASPQTSDEVVSGPCAKFLDRYALSLWKWVKDPVQYLDSGIEAISGLLESSGWQDSRHSSMKGKSRYESAVSH